MRDSIIVDNLMYSFAPTPENGLLIKSYLGGVSDEELPFLASCLAKWEPNMDAATFIDSTFNQREFFRFLSGF